MQKGHLNLGIHIAHSNCGFVFVFAIFSGHKLQKAGLTWQQHLLPHFSFFALVSVSAFSQFCALTTAPPSVCFWTSLVRVANSIFTLDLTSPKRPNFQVENFAHVCILLRFLHCVFGGLQPSLLS